MNQKHTSQALAANKVASTVDNPLLGGIRQIIEQSKGRIQQQVNSVMVEAYWQIGRLIVEHEQQGERRAEAGKRRCRGVRAGSQRGDSDDDPHARGADGTRADSHA